MFVVLGLFFTTINLAVTDYASAEVTSDGLVAYWSFDDATAIDNSGNGYTGTVYGATQDIGISGNCLRFDGYYDYIEFSNPVINSGPYSICLWVKPDFINDGQNHYIISNGGQTHSSYGFFMAQWDLYGYGYDNQWRFGVSNEYDTVLFDTSSYVENNDWTFLCGTYDGTDNPDGLKFYVNGVLKDTGSSCYWNVGSEDNLRIGAPSNVLSYFFKGLIDEVRIYNRVVTIDEVTSPIVDAGEDKIGDEPATFTFTGSHTGLGLLDTPVYEWDLDYDGGTFDVDTTGNGITHTWNDDFNGLVALRVTDNDGGWSIDSCSVIINNAAPEITTLTAPVDPVKVGTAIQVTSSFTDPGTIDTHTTTIDWGDGTTITVDIPLYDREISQTHTYEEAGVYTITLTITDDDGGTDTEIYEYVVVYDPDAGFVTGGGWINSPEGAYTQDPTLTGKANFGFVSKYRKGKTTPIGNTEFQFKAGNLNFHSSEYDWLVIAGSKAMYKGTGTINGGGNYGFMLSAIDGDLKNNGEDMFRIKIWDKDTDETVYDNNMGSDDDADPTTTLGGGQIVIHKK